VFVVKVAEGHGIAGDVKDSVDADADVDDFTD
jgi:hypothetical protein